MKIKSRAGVPCTVNGVPGVWEYTSWGNLCNTGGTSSPTGDTKVIEEKKDRIKVKKIPKIPNPSDLSDIGLVLLVLKILDNFKPAFPQDGFGITELHANEVPSGRNYTLMSDIQFDAYSAANKFSSIIFPLLIAISKRPSITSLQGQGNVSDTDLMKFIYAYSGGGIPGKRYLNIKFLYDMLDTNFGKLREGITQVENNVKAFDSIREKYNAQSDVNAQTLSMWMDAYSAEYKAIESLLALSKDSKSIMDVVAKAVVQIATQKASEAIPTTEDASKAIQNAAKKFFNFGAKTGPQIDKQSNSYRKALDRFQTSFAFSAPPGGGTIQSISTGFAGMDDIEFSDVSGMVFKVVAAGVVGYAIAKRKPLIGILGGALAVAAFGENLFGSPKKVQAAPQSKPQPLPMPIYRAPVVFWPRPQPPTIQTLSDDLEADFDK